MVNNTLWLVQTYKTDAYYSKYNFVDVGLFKSEHLAKKYVTDVLGIKEEHMIYCCDIKELTIVNYEG